MLGRAGYRATICPDSAWVFTRKGSRIGSIKKSFATACQKAGIEDFHIHDLSAYLRGLDGSGGVPLRTVADILRHSSISTTMGYAHLSPDNARAGVEALERSDLRSTDSRNVSHVVHRSHRFDKLRILYDAKSLIYKGAISSAGEHCLHTAGVTGSIPVSPTIFSITYRLSGVGVRQSVRQITRKPPGRHKATGGQNKSARRIPHEVTLIGCRMRTCRLCFSQCLHPFFRRRRHLLNRHHHRKHNPPQHFALVKFSEFAFIWL